MKHKLTKTYINKLNEPGLHWDSEIPGLGLRVNGNGTKSWLVQFRIRRDGKPKQRKVVLGRYEEFTPEQAREIAISYRRRGRVGDDPVIAIKEKMKEKADAPTMSDLCKQFMIEHGFEVRSADEYQRKIDVDILPALGATTKVSEVTPARLAKMRSDMSDRRSTWNRTRALLNAMFKLAVRDGHVDRNPVTTTRKYKEQPRDRFLSDEELRWFWKAASEEDYPREQLYKLLLLTGQRFSEVAGMHSSELYDDLWYLPAERTKNGRAHTVPLSSPVRAILAQLPRSGYLLTVRGTTPIRNSTYAANRIRDRVEELAGRELRHWTPHDLRRTAATGMQKIGIPIPVIEAVLNHVSGTRSGLVGVYQNYDYAKEMRDALEAWGRHVLDLVGETDSNVIPYKTAER